MPPFQAPLLASSILQQAQACDHISALAQLPLRSLGIKIPGARDLTHIALLTNLTELTLSLQV